MEKYFIAIPLTALLFIILASGCTQQLQTCTTDNECPSSFYCKQDIVCTQSEPIKCANISYCEKKPTENPVCGNNVCELGESLTCPQDCESPLCGNGVCGSGENNNNCPSDCPESPEYCVCARNYAPVCGSNDKTYGNRCLAECANVSVAYEGQCEENLPVCGKCGNECERSFGPGSPPNCGITTENFNCKEINGRCVKIPLQSACGNGVCEYGENREQLDCDAREGVPCPKNPSYCPGDCERGCTIDNDCPPGHYCEKTKMCETNLYPECYTEGRCVLKTCSAPEGYCCENGNIVEAAGPLVNGLCRGDDGTCFYCKCLPPWTMIAAEQGSTPIQELKVGDLVWSLNSKGEKELVPIVKVNSVIVPKSHTMAHVTLEDGRELFSSAGHPTANGKTFGELRKGDLLDNSKIVGINVEKYNGDKTYDILPGSETGYYWANGILIASTLK